MSSQRLAMHAGEAVAEACGAEGIRVTEPGDVEGALRQGLAATRQRPALVEVMVAQCPYPKV